MSDPTQAAHVLGKLLKYVGEDRVLWGTDSIWYGSPQDQIQAFRAFQIAEPYRERYGYPELTPALRAQVFGLNAAKPYHVSPEEIRQRLKLSPGQKVQAIQYENRIEFIPLRSTRSMRGFVRGIDTRVVRDRDRV